MTVERQTVERPIPGSGGGGVTDDGVTTGSVTEDPDGNGGGNTYDEILESLGTTHRWLLDEASGATFADSGATGGFTLTLDDADDHWHQGWGPGVRGSPAVYGMWKPNGRPNPVFSGGPAVTGYTSGGMGCWFVLMDIDSSPMCLVSVTHSNNTSLIHQLIVTTDARLRYEVQGNISRRIRVETAAGFVQPGVVYYVHGEQPVDGGGLDLYVDGVDQGLTSSLSGGASIDDFVDQILTPAGGPFPATQTRIGANGQFSSDGAWIGCVGGPYLNVNVIFGSAGVASVFSASNTNATPTDYHEYVYDLGWRDQSIVEWLLGAWEGFNNQNMQGGLGPVERRSSGFTSPSVINSPDNAGTGLQLESRYQRFKSIFGSNNPTYFAIAGQTNWEPTAGRTSGTVACVVTVNGVPDGDRKIIHTFGTTANNSLEFGLVGSTLGWQVFFRAFESSVETYRVLSGIVGIGSGPDFHMITVVQPGDGSGPSLYFDDTQVDNAPVISTNPDVWVQTFGDSSGQRWGGEQGSASIDNWEPGHLHAHHGFIKALTAEQISGLWDAVNGTFSAVPDNADNFITVNLKPLIDWKFNESGGDLLNTGGSSGGDVPWVDGPTAREVANGDVNDPGEAIETDASGSPDDFAGGTFATLSSLETILQNLASTGTFVFIFRVPSWTTLEVPFTFENDSGFFSMRVSSTTGGNVIVEMFRNPATDGWRLVGTAVVDDNEWHVGIVVQDGVSPILYMDGVVDDDTPSNSTPTLWVPDLWGGPGPDPTKFGIGAVSVVGGASGIFGFTGFLDRILFSEQQLSAAQVEYFTELYLG